MVVACCLGPPLARCSVRRLDKVVVVWPIHVLFRSSVFHVTVILVNDVRFFHIWNGGALVIFDYEAGCWTAFLVRYEL